MTSQYFSPPGLEKLKQELEERRNKIRPELASKISEARELGDLSENAEYQDYKEMQSFNEGRIEELEEIIKGAIILAPHQQGDIVAVGSTVIALGPTGKEQKFTIVGASESDPVKGFISNESPLGQSFLGHKKDDEVEVRTPSGRVKYKVLEVS